MDDTDDKIYELYDEDATDNGCSGLFSCLYTYTIGSCLYFKSDDASSPSTSSVNNGEELELKPMTLSDHAKYDKSKLEEDSGWKKVECKMKKRIQYHFTDHIKRWMDSDQRRFPWKMILHLLLVALVTTQVTNYDPYLP